MPLTRRIAEGVPVIEGVTVGFWDSAAARAGIDVDGIELSIAQDPQSPPELLRRMAHNSPQLWPALLQNPTCPPDAREYIEAHTGPVDSDAAQADPPGVTSPGPADVGRTGPQDADDAAVHSPATTASTLADIAARRPDLGAAIAAHPSVYDALLTWLAQYGSPQASAAARARQASGGASTPAPAPVAQSATPMPQAPVTPAPAVSAPQAPVVPAPAVSAPQATTESASHAAAEHPSGFDVANSVVSGTFSIITKLYGLLLIIVAVIGIVAMPSAWWVGLLIIAYGVYLLLPGWKLVIW